MLYACDSIKTLLDTQMIYDYFLTNRRFYKFPTVKQVHCVIIVLFYIFCLIQCCANENKENNFKRFWFVRYDSFLCDKCHEPVAWFSVKRDPWAMILFPDVPKAVEVLNESGCVRVVVLYGWMNFDLYVYCQIKNLAEFKLEWKNTSKALDDSIC